MKSTEHLDALWDTSLYLTNRTGVLIGCTLTSWREEITCRKRGPHALASLATQLEEIKNHKLEGRLNCGLVSLVDAYIQRWPIVVPPSISSLSGEQDKYEYTNNQPATYLGFRSEESN